MTKSLTRYLEVPPGVLVHYIIQYTPSPLFLYIPLLRDNWIVCASLYPSYTLFVSYSGKHLFFASKFPKEG